MQDIPGLAAPPGAGAPIPDSIAPEDRAEYLRAIANGPSEEAQRHLDSLNAARRRRIARANAVRRIADLKQRRADTHRLALSAETWWGDDEPQPGYGAPGCGSPSSHVTQRQRSTHGTRAGHRRTRATRAGPDDGSSEPALGRPQQRGPR